MRAGRVALQSSSPAPSPARAYGQLEITERHRHRYEFNRDYEETPDATQVSASPAAPPTATGVEIVEAPDHPWFLGCQFHPEFKSKPLAPHPLFAAFIRASLENHHYRLSATSAESRVTTAEPARD